MDFAPVYLIRRFFYRLFNFFHHWYVDGSRAFGRTFITMLTEVDRVLAFKITLRYFFQPLYRDYTIMGRILGIIFRTFRVLIGVIIYPMLIILFIAVYLAWVLIPAVVLYGAIFPLYK